MNTLIKIKLQINLILPIQSKVLKMKKKKKEKIVENVSELEKLLQLRT